MQNQIEPRVPLWQRIKRSWNPLPIEQPKVDPDIEALDPVQRSAESIRYSIMSLEFWVSPNGQVREWLRHNGRLAVWLSIPTFLVLPIITFALIQMASWLATLSSIAIKLVVLPILALAALIVILVISQIIKGIFK